MKWWRMKFWIAQPMRQNGKQQRDFINRSRHGEHRDNFTEKAGSNIKKGLFE